MTNAIGHIVFETALGFMGLAWSEAGLTRLCLPQSSRDAVERRLFRLDGIAGTDSDKPPQWVQGLIADIRAYAEGDIVDFSGVPVDLAGTDDFQRAIYEAARRLAFGETTTYANWPNAPATQACRARRAPPSAPTRCRWSFPAIASSPPAARSGAFPPPAVLPPRKRCSGWKASASARRPQRRPRSVSESRRSPGWPFDPPDGCSDCQRQSPGRMKLRIGSSNSACLQL